MKRFDFLKENYEELYKICNEADEEKNMNKARQALELIVRMFGAKKRHLFDRIAEASTKAKMPKEIIAACHQVRLVGNKASHDETLAWNKITDNDIEKCLNALFKIVAWLALSHDKKIFQATDYLKSKRETIKKFGIDINPLDIEENILNFDNKVEDELTKDVFENDEEVAERIANLPLRHIGYGILDKREKDTYTGFVFPMFHIEKEDKIIFSDIDAFIANADSMNEDFIDGKILVGLKVFVTVLNLDQLGLQRGNHGCNLCSLCCVVLGVAELGDDVGLRVNLRLHLTLADFTELAGHVSLQGCDSVGDGAAVAVDGTAEGLGLLHVLYAALVALLCGQKTVLAAAVCKLCGKVFVAADDGVYDLQRCGGVLYCHVVEDGVHRAELCTDGGEVLTKHSADGLYGLTALLAVGTDCGTEQLGVVVCRGLRTKRRGCGTAVVVPTVAVAVEEVTECASEETADAGTPEVASSETVAEAVVASEHPRPSVVHVVVPIVWNDDCLTHSFRV